MDYHQMSYTSEKAYFLAFRTHLRVLILVLVWSTPSLPAVAGVHVEVAAKPRIVNLQGKTNWTAKRVVSVADLTWYGCGDLGSTCMYRPDSYIGWQVNSENVAYSSNAVHTSVCTPTREPADVTNATLELMRAMDSEPDYTNPVDPQSYWSISGVLETCDAKHWVYVTGGIGTDTISVDMCDRGDSGTQHRNGNRTAGRGHKCQNRMQWGGAYDRAGQRRGVTNCNSRKGADGVDKGSFALIYCSCRRYYAHRRNGDCRR